MGDGVFFVSRRRNKNDLSPRINNYLEGKTTYEKHSQKMDSGKNTIL